MTRGLVLIVLVLHGLIHFMGFAKAFGMADLAQLTQPISRGMGLVWLAAGLAMLAAGIHLMVAPRSWWITGLVAVVLSQAVILTAWQDARFGTVANLVILAAVLYGVLSQGPSSFRARYEEGAAELLASALQSPESAERAESPESAEMAERAERAEAAERDLLTERDLAHLPDPVRRYVLRSGFVGRPKVQAFRVVARGRIRATPDDPWMPFTAEQQNTLHPPSRFFHMRARKAGLPVDVLHVFRDAHAAMQAKVLSLIPVVDGRGPEMDRAETVTLFNDLALMAPGALADPGIEWETVDERTARGRFTAWDRTISATLVFDDQDRLVDFVSEDRAASPDGKRWIRQPWSTPVEVYQDLGGLRVMRCGEGRWHPDGAEPYSYLEFELVDLEVIG